MFVAAQIKARLFPCPRTNNHDPGNLYFNILLTDMEDAVLSFERDRKKVGCGRIGGKAPGGRFIDVDLYRLLPG